MPITPYGNAETGEYIALFTGAFEARYPKASRLIFGFAVLCPDRFIPADGPDGDGLFAVAVCNLSEGTSPKSKAYKIRRAMLQPGEVTADPMLLIQPPPPEHFTEAYQGRPRVLEIRVENKVKDGRRVSVVTHIRRPRDGEWQGIEGKYEGAAPGTVNGRPFWLRADGRAVSIDEPKWSKVAEERLTPGSDEIYEWVLWNGTRRANWERWLTAEGKLNTLSEDEIAALGLDSRIRYRIAQRRVALGWSLD